MTCSLKPVILIYYVDPQDQFAILPEMEGLNGKQIKLYARGYNAGNAFKIGMMTDPNDVSTFVEIATQTLTTSYQEYEYTLGEGNHSGDKVASSFSWRNQVAYNVDNWLITPQVFLNGTLKLWVRCAENEYPDHYDVYVSTSSVIDINNFTLLHEPGAPTETWTEITVDLSAFNGAQGYIAICHQDYDKECLWIDDFGIYTGNDWVELNGVTSPVTIEGLALSTAYEWQVQGINCDGQGSLTDWSESTAFTTTNCETVLVDLDHPFTEGFEGADFAPNCWESIPLNNQSY